MKLAIVAALFLAASLFAQTETGTVAGAITDAAQAAIPNAQIVARNQNTGLTYTGIAKDSGAYVISALPPGTYELTVSTPGFSSEVRHGVVVNVQARVEINFAMRIGAVKETVEVRGESPILESETSSVGQVVENKTIVTLPLNGRNYSQLALLAPGATPNPGSRATDGFSVNGSLTFNNLYLIDGADNNSHILGGDTASTQALHPSVDAVQEFKLETSNYSAEFGHSQGGVISVSIKSGTNAWHGTAFEFLRNDKLDANNFFSNRAGLVRPPVRRNQFGGTLGAPIIKNRTFFFASYQGTRLQQPTTATTTVPVAGMAQGNFGSTALYDPLNVVAGVRQQFPNNVIPVNRLDPVGLKLAALYPSPNQPGSVNNFTSNVPNNTQIDEADLRVDHRFRAADSMFVRFSKEDKTTSQGSVFASPGNGGVGGGAAVVGGYPVIQVPFAWSLAANETHIFTPAMVNEFRAAYTHASSNQLVPETTSLYDQFGIKGVPPFPGQTGLPGFTINGFSALGDKTFSPNPKLSQVRQASDALSWVVGGHTLKFGGAADYFEDYAAGTNVSRGALTFNGQFTSRVPGTGIGSALADLLLGQTSSAQLTNPLHGDLRSRNYGLFLNDTWKVSRTLTLTLGLRYEIQTPFWDHNNHQSNFDLDPRDATYGTVVNASGSGTLSRAFENQRNLDFAPRLGFAWQVAPKTVIRGAAGIFYGGWGFEAPANLGTANIPYFVSVTNTSSTSAAVSNVVLANGFPPGMVDPANAVNPAAVALLASSRPPKVYQWNMGVERELVGNSVLSVTYVGSGSSYLLGTLDANQPVPGAGAVNSRRPFPTFGAVTLNASYAHSTYHALQAKLEKRFSRGLSLLVSYAWSHALDNSVNPEDTGNGSTLPQDPANTNAEKASSPIDQRQRLTASFIYELPFHGGGLWSRVAHGWQLGGIFTAANGTPLTPLVSPNPANTTGPARPNRLLNSGTFQQGVNEWFNPAAYAAATPFNFGNSGRDVIVSPGLVNLDALIARSFQFTERFHLEVRGEFFNFTNSVHFGFPVLTVTLPQAGQITSSASPNRQVQLGMRFVF